MKHNQNRRSLIKKAAISAALLPSATTLSWANGANHKAKIVVIGGGVAGVLVARELRSYIPNVEVTIIEQSKIYHTCFKSNEGLSGLRTSNTLNFDYKKVVNQGINVHHDRVSKIDRGGKYIVTKNGSKIAYDKLVVATGVAFDFSDVDGLDSNSINRFPHAWSGHEQYDLLKHQIDNMKDGGTIVIGTPRGKFKCPPGPYERASLLARYIQQNKPKSKIIIADASNTFSKQALFEQGWKRLYNYGNADSIIERIPGSEGGRIVRIDAQKNAVTLENGEKIKVDVCNLIPRQNAGELLSSSGLTDNENWGKIDKSTMKSLVDEDIYILGDAANASAMPKSAFSASSQAGVCSQAIAADMLGTKLVIPRYTNTCFSLLNDSYGISIAMNYIYDENDNEIVGISGGTTDLYASQELLSREVTHSRSWFNTLTQQMFG